MMRRYWMPIVNFNNVWCFAKAGLRRTNVELTTKDN